MSPPTKNAPTGRKPSRGPSSGVILALALAAATLLGIALAARLAASRDPLRRAWSAAQAAGTYAFKGTTRATTDTGSVEYAVAGTGEAAGALLLAVRPATSDSAGVSVTYRIAWPEVGVGMEVRGELDPHALALILPAGDPLALLATGHGAALGPVEAVGGRGCRRVSFHIGAEAYGAWWRAHPQLLPVNADSGGLDKLTGEGTLWQEPDSGLPCRIAARLDLPRLGGDRPGVGEVDWVYREWGTAVERIQPDATERSR